MSSTATFTGKRNWATAFYWVGVALTLACLALILAGNTDLGWRLEHQAFPLSWAVAGAAVLAFLAAEYSQSDSPLPSEVEDQSPQLPPDFEAVEFEI